MFENDVFSSSGIFKVANSVMQSAKFFTVGSFENFMDLRMNAQSGLIPSVGSRCGDLEIPLIDIKIYESGYSEFSIGVFVFGGKNIDRMFSVFSGVSLFCSPGLLSFSLKSFNRG